MKNIKLKSMRNISKNPRYANENDSAFAPNDFYHVISDVIDMTSYSINYQKYYILVIFVSNDFINVQETIKTLVEASQKVKFF